MRIAVNASIVEPRLSGLGVYTVNLLQGLAQLHDDLVAYTPFPEVCGVDAGRLHQVSRRVLPSRGRLGHLQRLLWAQLSLPGLLARDRSTVLLCPFPEGILRAAVAQVVVVHDVIPLEFREFFPRQYWYFRYVLPVILRQARAVIAVSEGTRREVIARFGISPAKVQVVTPGYDAGRFHGGIDPAEVAARYGLGAYVLYVGNLLPHKNLAGLLRAFAAVGPRFEHTLVLAGHKDPRYYPALEAEVGRLGLAHRVRFLDYVPATDLPALYAGASASVLPSLSEGFGLPVLEAMACGTPVVAARLASVETLADGAAMLVEPADPGALGESLARVLATPALRETLRARGLQRARGFHWGRTAAEVLAVVRAAGSAA